MEWGRSQAQMRCAVFMSYCLVQQMDSVKLLDGIPGQFTSCLLDVLPAPKLRAASAPFMFTKQAQASLCPFGHSGWFNAQALCDLGNANNVEDRGRAHS